MAKVYHDGDSDLALLLARQVAVLGYGSQGRAQAMNLRDSGVSVVVGTREGHSKARAAADGFEALSIGAAVQRSNLAVLCLPDVDSGRVYDEEVKANLKAGSCLVFAHGFAVHYGLVSPGPDLDVILVAPMGAGAVMRQRFEEGSGVPGMVAVRQDASGKAWPLALAYGIAIGCGRVAMIETTFEEETLSDLFGEQAVLCGGLPALMAAAFQTLVSRGIQPEVAYIACVHEVKLIVDLIAAKGLDGMVRGISQTAEWGAYEAGPKVIGAESKWGLEEIWRAVQSGEFARNWIEEAKSGGPILRRRREKCLENPIHKVGERVRSLLGLG